jgi:Ca2+ transporting ATPase
VTHHFQCAAGGKEWADIDCDVFNDPHPMTMALSVLVTIEMLNAMNSLSENQSLIKMPPWTNIWLMLAIGLSMSLHFMILYTPMFNTIFHICPLGWEEWAAVMKISLPVVIIDESLKFLSRNYIDGKYKAENNMVIWFLTVCVMWAAYFTLTAYSPVFTLEQYASIFF